MKAVWYSRYGGPKVLQVTEVPKPVPAAGELLIETHAASINFADWAFVTGKPAVVRVMGSGLFSPKNHILGSDVSGRVVGAGDGVTRFRIGDEVFGDISECGWGGFAEYVCAHETALAPKPTNITHEEAAALPQASVTALQGLRDKGRVFSGKLVLVHGASGGIGTAAIQIAKAFGAVVVGVCSGRNADTVHSLGADKVIDYTREDFARGAERYDTILSIAGDRPLTDFRRVLTPNGIFVLVGGSGGMLARTMLVGPWISRKGGQHIVSLASRPNLDDLLAVKELVEYGKLRPVIDTQYELAETAAAIEKYGKRHARGKIVIRIRPEAA